MCMCSLQLGNTVLHEACLRGHTELVTVILSSGMPVDIRNVVSWYTVSRLTIVSREAKKKQAVRDE